MSVNLFDDYLLPRASRYSDPQNPNDILPIPWGDLTVGGSLGVWDCPCIDVANTVYAIAGCPILSVGNGNVITVYLDGVETVSDFTVNVSNDYEGQGNIAIITFSSGPDGAIVSVRCKGRASGGVLIENPLSIVEDFLTNLVGMSSDDIDATTLSSVKSFCTGKGYQAAGLLNKDQAPEKTVKEILSSYLGRAHFNPDGIYVFSIDTDTTIYNPAGYIPAHRIGHLEAKQKLSDLINQLIAEYAHNYVTRKYQEHDDGEGTRNQISQGVYGVRKTKKELLWCRNQTDVNIIQQILLLQTAQPFWEVEFTDNSLKLLAIQLGEDYICATLLSLYDREGRQYYNQIFKVLGMEIDFNKKIIAFTCLDTGKFRGQRRYLSVAAGLELSFANQVRLGGERDTNIYEM